MAFLRRALVIDPGTANTVIFKDDTVVLDEPSIIATDSKTGKLMALGTQARTTWRWSTSRPLSKGWRNG